MNKPEIGVIMAVYNAEKYIEEAVMSVLEQTYKNFYMFIVLDACTDRTEEVLIKALEAHQGNFSIIKENIQGGCPKRRQQALEASKRLKYCVICDADDVSYPQRFEKQVNFLETHPDIFCVGSFATKIDENGEIFGEMNYPPEKNEDIINMIIKECKNPILDPSVMFRTNIAINKLGGYSLDPSIYTVPDFDLWLRAIKKGYKFYNFQESLVKYRIHNEGVTNSRKKEMIKHHMIIWKKFKREYRNIKEDFFL